MLLDFVFVFLLIIIACFAGISFGLRSSRRETGISTNSLCPACGHAGCKLTYVPPTPMEDDKGKAHFSVETARVMRRCDTCAAIVYEKTVMDPKKWIAP